MPFLKTAEQHRQMAQLLREAGNETLANQHDLIALAIEHRQRRVDEAAQQGVKRLHAAPTTCGLSSTAGGGGLDALGG